MNSTALGRIGIIKAGRVARALACALERHTTESILVYTRRPSLLGADQNWPKSIMGTDRLAQVTACCDVLVLTVADDAMAQIVACLAELSFGSTPFLFHVSGRSGVALLRPLLHLLRGGAAIHPAMTFTGDPRLEVRRMAGTSFAITGSSETALAEARGLVDRLGGIGVEIAEEHRALYHAALCHGANHLVTLISGALDALSRAGVNDPSDLLGPLARAALDNALNHGLGGLSGPVLRGDSMTGAQHGDALRRNCPDLAKPYQAMAMATLDALGRREGSPNRQPMRDTLAAAFA